MGIYGISFYKDSDYKKIYNYVEEKKLPYWIKYIKKINKTLNQEGKTLTKYSQSEYNNYCFSLNEYFVKVH